MKIYRATFLLICVFSFGVFAEGWEFFYRPADAKYAVYGNSLGDPVTPSGSDNKIAFELRGQVAREMFEAIGPDKKDSCAQEEGRHLNPSLVCMTVTTEHDQPAVRSSGHRPPR